MKEFERHQFEKMEKLAAEIERNPMTKKLRADECAENIKKRQAAAAKIEDLNLDLAACRVIQTDIDTLILKLAELDAEKEKTKIAINEKRYFMAKERSGIEGGIRHEEQILLSCYDPIIDEAILFFRDKLDWLRSPGRISSSAAGGVRNLLTEKITLKTESNFEAVSEALRYCQDAIQTLEAIKLLPEVDLQIIQEMKKAIPDVNVYREYQGEKPMGKGANPSFLAKIQLDLENKVDALLGRSRH